MADEWMRTEDAAEYLQVPAKTLIDWRYRRIGPPWAKFGRHVRYRRADLEAWALDQIHEPRS